jgi:hypothetical protein
LAVRCCDRAHAASKPNTGPNGSRKHQPTNGFGYGFFSGRRSEAPEATGPAKGPVTRRRRGPAPRGRARGHFGAHGVAGVVERAAGDFDPGALDDADGPDFAAAEWRGNGGRWPSSECDPAADRRRCRASSRARGPRARQSDRRIHTSGRGRRNGDGPE